MTNENILDQKEQPLTDLDPNKNYYEELVGDGKKFKDTESLAKGKYMSDLHIKMLETRMDELRELYLAKDNEVKSRATLEELADMLKKQPQQPASNDTTLNVKEVNDKPTLDLNELDKRFETKLQEYEVTKQQQANVNQVKNKLKERFGDNYQPLVKQQIEYLGLTDEDFNSLARKSPSALFKTLGMDDVKESYQAPPRSNNTFSFKGPPKRTWTYYQDMKNKNPKAYLDPKTLIQMEKDALDQGDSFYDGNFGDMKFRNKGFTLSVQ